MFVTREHCLIFETNRKEGNDQESVQLPDIFRPRHHRERRTHLKQRHHNLNITSRKLKVQLLLQKMAKRLSKNKFHQDIHARHTMTEIVNHSRSAAPERSVKILLEEWGEGRGG